MRWMKSFFIFWMVVIFFGSKNILYAACATNCGVTTIGDYKCISGDSYTCSEIGNLWVLNDNCTASEVCSASTCRCVPLPSATPTSYPTDYCVWGDSSCQTHSVGYTCSTSLFQCKLSGINSCSCSYVTPTPAPATDTPVSTSTPASTATPAWGPCEDSTEGPTNYCDYGVGYCRYFCDYTEYPGGGWASEVSCYTTESCSLGFDVPCSSMVGDLYVGQMYCPSSLLPSPTSYCAPFQCQNVGYNNLCVLITPYFYINGACGSGASRCDNCGGVACEWCPGSTLTPVPTVAGFTDPRYASTCYTDTFSICSGSINCFGGMFPTSPSTPQLLTPANGTTYAVGSGVPLSWSLADWGIGCPNVNNYLLCVSSDQLSCDLAFVNLGSATSYNLPVLVSDPYITWQVTANNGSIGVSSTVGYFGVSSSPVATGINIYNSESTIVGVEAGDRNHICQTTFSGTASPRIVRFVANASDADGGADVTGMTLTWHGISHAMTLQAPSGNNRAGIYNWTFTSGENDSGIYGVGVTVIDASGQTSQITPRSFKVWDCNVPVMGTIYDASIDGQSCPTIGFTTQADDSLNFDAVEFYGTGTPNVIMSPLSNSTYGNNPIKWGYSYLPVFNDGNVASPDGVDNPINGSGRSTRVNNLCPGASFNLSSLVSAYDVSPSATIDFSFYRNQEHWFQVQGGDVKAKVQLISGVPVTATTPFLNIDNSDYGSSNNGMCSSSDVFVNRNGVAGNDYFGSPNNWYVQKDTLGSKKYSYLSLYNDYYVALGQGTTVPVGGSIGNTGVYFVNGNYNIMSDNILTSTDFLMVVASGEINIDSGVNRFDGILVANGGIGASGISASQLVINGSLYSFANNVRLSRNYIDPTVNNTTPAVVVRYRPEQIFTLPPKLSQLLSEWKQY
jgi:hypothetical protein